MFLLLLLLLLFTSSEGPNTVLILRPKEGRRRTLPKLRSKTPSSQSWVSVSASQHCYHILNISSPTTDYVQGCHTLSGRWGFAQPKMCTKKVKELWLLCIKFFLECESSQTDLKQRQRRHEVLECVNITCMRYLYCTFIPANPTPCSLKNFCPSNNFDPEMLLVYVCMCVCVCVCV